jgi:hypothetical protein
VGSCEIVKFWRRFRSMFPCALVATISCRCVVLRLTDVSWLWIIIKAYIKYMYHEHNNKQRISVFILCSLFMKIMFIKVERMPWTWIPPTLPCFVVIFVVSRNVFFPKNEKPRCTFGVDVLGSVETQISEKRRFCVRLLSCVINITELNL